MKRVEAVIRPNKLEEVKEALLMLGVEGMTLFEVRGKGREKGHKELYRGMEYQVDLLPKVFLLLYVNDDRVEVACDAILRAASTGKVGDGKIVVSEISRVIGIRNGKRDNDALVEKRPTSPKSH
jgi:nitrogen regulatory protein P-II 1